MKKKSILMLVWVALFSSVAFVSCDDDDSDAEPSADQQRISEFMMRAAASDMFEIQSGELAKTKGAQQSTKDFGQQLVTDHTRSSNEMKALATKLGITLPTTLPADKQAMLTELNGLSGMAFDRRFAAMQVTAHEEAVNLYETSEDNIENDEVEAFINKTLPVLQMHLEHARQHKTMIDGMPAGN
ncbi:DUF4142 domain-containing protein [Rufibacter immobilis]|uniref:DUF4142 domain-containing protein n=1 Tax=Rufibacter immobilis TaxID=1348778 RepID=A0A3M9MVD9_9BACT|nr:DUF4142 domain-containing protein [Rufibacter immobilis]RNI29474.1 DUF4142 domain-containing protein [Rufibacter immobilis]